MNKLLLDEVNNSCHNGPEELYHLVSVYHMPVLDPQPSDIASNHSKVYLALLEATGSYIGSFT